MKSPWQRLTCCSEVVCSMTMSSSLRPAVDSAALHLWFEPCVKYCKVVKKTLGHTVHTYHTSHLLLLVTFSRFSLVNELGTCGHCIALGSSLKLQYSTKPCITFQAACFSGLGCSCSQATDLVWWYIVVLSICLNAQRFENLQRLIELIEKHVFTVNQMLKAPLTAFLSCMHGKTWASLSNLTHCLSNPSGRQASPHVILADKENKQNAWSDDGLCRFVLYLTLDLTISPHSPEVGNATMSVI